MLKVLYVQIFVKNTYIQYSMKFGHFFALSSPMQGDVKVEKKEWLFIHIFQSLQEARVAFLD